MDKIKKLLPAFIGGACFAVGCAISANAVQDYISSEAIVATRNGELAVIISSSSEDGSGLINVKSSDKSDQRNIFISNNFLAVVDKNGKMRISIGTDDASGEPKIVFYNSLGKIRKVIE